MHPHLTRLAAITLLAATCALPARAQPEPPPKRVVVDLFLTVQGGKKADLSNLTPQDFRVTDEGQQQTAESLARADSLPLSVAILLDSSGSRARQLFRAEREPIKDFLRQALREQDRAMVVSFNDRAFLDAELTNEMAVLSAAVDRGTEQARGATAHYDAIWSTCEDLDRGRARRILVLASDAVDNRSKKADLRGAPDALHRTSTIVYVINLLGPDAVRRAGRRGLINALELAAQTGGLVISVDNPSEVADAYRQIAGIVDAQHVLRYAPPGLTRKSKFHKVKVEILRKGAKVITRAGYIAPGEQR